MKDINTLSGIEFENLCQVLLQKAGFDRVFIYYVHKHNAGRRLYELQYCDMTAYFDLFKEVDSIKIIDQIKQIKAMLAGLW